MPLTVTEVGEITENQKIWLNNPTLVTTWLDRDISDTKWDTALDIEFAGANYIQCFLWAQKTSGQGAETKKVDLEIHARTQTASALLPVLICRAEFGPEDQSLFVASGSRPINDAAIDISAKWHMCTRIDFSEPKGTRYPYAFNFFGAGMLKGNALGAILQIPTRGWTELMLRVKQVTDKENPSRFLCLYRER